MDGFVVGGSTQAIPSPSKVTLRNCVSEYNYRQGLSVLRCAGLLVSSGSYSNTGQLGVGKGTSPMSGIDSESEGVASGYYNFGLVIDGATLDNNKGAGLYFALGSLKSVIRGCTVTNNGAYGVACTAASKECVIENNYIKTTATPIVLMVAKYTTSVTTICIPAMRCTHQRGQFWIFDLFPGLLLVLIRCLTAIPSTTRQTRLRLAMSVSRRPDRTSITNT